MSNVIAQMRRLYAGISFGPGKECELVDDGDGVLRIDAWRRQEPIPDLQELAALPALAEVVTVTAQQFRDRFTDAELAAMLASADMGVKILVLKIQTADPFPMDRPSVQQGLDYLVSKGILTEPRRAAVGSLV